MPWAVSFHGEFDVEFQALDEDLQDELLAHAKLLQEFGPSFGRPAVDTLAGSQYANMKELRFNWKGGVWRVAFAFDPKRTAILLVAGDKGGTNQRRFYKVLIATADDRLDDHLAGLRRAETAKKKETHHGKKP